MNIRFDSDDIDAILDMARENPQGFLYLTKKYCKNVTVDQVEASMNAWGINPNEGQAPSTGNRSSRKRQNYRGRKGRK